MASKKKDKSTGSSEMFHGTVTSVNIKGIGINSGQLLFTVLSDGPKPVQRPFVARIGSHEPGVFSAMADFVMAAYLAQVKIGLTYTEPEPSIDTTSRVIEMFVPDTRGLKKVQRGGKATNG